MKVILINTVYPTGSTGMICREISRMLTGGHIENHILYAIGQSEDPLCIRYADDRAIRLQALRSRLSGRYGFVSEQMTERLITELRRLQPDIVHLHNLHSHNCNLEMLFTYLAATGIKVVWTFHDCWAFTGYCTHYAMSGCAQWRSGCVHCPQRRKFSWFFDRSAELYDAKRRLTDDLDLTLVAPSEWMAKQIRSSFLREHETCVIRNGIDLQVFRPTPGVFRERNGLQDRFLILGVASDWGRRKGLDVFSALSERLDDRFRIVLVGTDGQIERQLPPGVLSVRRTADRRELAALYSTANVFLNPTREDTFPTVNLEALACGTPVITFDTGGSPEALTADCGVVVPQDDLDALETAVRSVCGDRPFSAERCMARAAQFDQADAYRQYLALYRRLDMKKR